MVGVSARRPFLQVLLQWDEKPIHGVRIDMFVDAYWCILAGIDPSLGNPASFNTQLLHGHDDDRCGTPLLATRSCSPKGERCVAIVVVEPDEQVADNESDSSNSIEEIQSDGEAGEHPSGMVEDDEDSWPSKLACEKVHVEERQSDEYGRLHSYRRMVPTCTRHERCKTRRYIGARQRLEFGCSEPVALVDAQRRPTQHCQMPYGFGAHDGRATFVERPMPTISAYQITTHTTQTRAEQPQPQPPPQPQPHPTTTTTTANHNHNH